MLRSPHVVHTLKLWPMNWGEIMRANAIRSDAVEARPLL